MTHTKESLVAFEGRVADAFLAKRILSPIHLCSPSQAAPLIEIFAQVKPTDWKFATWRSHYAALLSGIPEEELFRMILGGHSMSIFSKKHRFLSSAIVGGMLPIVCGVALAAKRLGLDEHVWVCVGDMCARTGLFHEFLQYCDGHGLPVTIVIEDNGLSTSTPTDETWGGHVEHVATDIRIIKYRYERQGSHVGVGKFVDFN
jgi:pyruvate dehydrogenase E1 component alpha subunit